MNFSKIKVKPIQIANNQIDEFDLEILRLNANELPPDYLEFINLFGEGILGEYIRIYPFDKLCDLTKEWKTWQNSKAEIKFFLTNEKNKSILIGDTLDGDIIFYLKNNYYLAARQYEEKVYNLGTTLNDVFYYFENDSNYGGKNVTNFTPFDSSLMYVNIPKSQKHILEKYSENEVMEFSKGLRELKDKAADFNSEFMLLEFGERKNEKIREKYSKLSFLWSDIQSELHNIFYKVSKNYQDDIDWKLNYPELKKSEYYEEIRNQHYEHDESERQSWEDFANDGLNDFYEGYDETSLGID